MRRYIFYSVIALLTFGFGLFAAIKFFQNARDRISVNAPEIYINSTKQNKNDFLGDLKKRTVENKNQPLQDKVEFTCTNEILSTVWRALRKDKDFRAELEKVNDCSTVIEIEKIIDLNNDGKKEVIVGGKDGLVNGASSQAIWIVYRLGKKYKILLAGSAESYEIKKTLTNGFRDIFMKHHMSAASSYDSTYKFINGKYRESKCLFVDYEFADHKTVTTCAEEDARIEKEFQ